MAKRRGGVSVEHLPDQPIKETALKPPNGPPCPKCGEHKGWTGPRFQKGKRVFVKVPASATRFKTLDVETLESLVYTCTVCGFDRHDPCKDE